jgi:hypothetical protein
MADWQRVALDHTIPTITVSVRYLYASVGAWKAWLYPANGGAPAQIADKAGTTSVDIPTAASVGELLYVGIGASSLAHGASYVGVEVDISQAGVLRGTLALPPATVQPGQVAQYVTGCVFL